MMDNKPQKCALQDVLLKLHRKLVEITGDSQHSIGKKSAADIKLESADYLERLLYFLERELIKYRLYSKFENMTEEVRRKELFILLTKHLGVKLFQKEAGDANMCKSYFMKDNSFNRENSNNNCGSGFERQNPLESLHENKKQNNFHIQYQLYSRILRNIQLELHGISRMKRDSLTEVLLVGLCIREFSKLSHLPAKQRRQEMLKLLADELTEKCKQISLTDMIKDAKIENKTFFQKDCTSPSKKWKKMINLGPKEPLMHLLYDSYPLFLVEMFLEYLSQEKQNIVSEQENIFRTKIMLLKKEGLLTVESIQKNLRYKKYIEAFLNEYIQQFQSYYKKTENEFYRQEWLKNKIEETVMQIKII